MLWNLLNWANICYKLNISFYFCFGISRATLSNSAMTREIGGKTHNKTFANSTVAEFKVLREVVIFIDIINVSSYFFLFSFYSTIFHLKVEKKKAPEQRSLLGFNRIHRHNFCFFFLDGDLIFVFSLFLSFLLFYICVCVYVSCMHEFVFISQ